jgi:pyruvate/2-oxoglutarate dehydrogenase complex dihydrolipoamide dehydrogenase (E3) component
VAHAASKKIVFIEERYFGGTCPNRGCAPNNILDAASHALDEIEIVFAHAVTVGKTNPD